jgi:probable rRNA maturation factor
MNKNMPPFDLFDAQTDEPATGIEFVSEDVDFQLPDEARTMQWLHAVAEAEGASIHTLTYIFCSDDYLYDINLRYLDHDTYTDVITFPYAEPGEAVQGDIFISIDRVADNARLLATDPHEEMRRVLVHGLLHLLGHSDKTAPEQAAMRLGEDKHLANYHQQT